MRSGTLISQALTNWRLRGISPRPQADDLSWTHDADTTRREWSSVTSVFHVGSETQCDFVLVSTDTAFCEVGVIKNIAFSSDPCPFFVRHRNVGTSVKKPESAILVFLAGGVPLINLLLASIIWPTLLEIWRQRLQVAQENGAAHSSALSWISRRRLTKPNTLPISNALSATGLPVHHVSILNSLWSQRSMLFKLSHLRAARDVKAHPWVALGVHHACGRNSWLVDFWLTAVVRQASDDVPGIC